jgi:hypothetical protein
VIYFLDDFKRQPVETAYIIQLSGSHECRQTSSQWFWEIEGSGTLPRTSPRSKPPKIVQGQLRRIRLNVKLKAAFVERDSWESTLSLATKRAALAGRPSSYMLRL